MKIVIIGNGKMGQSVAKTAKDRGHEIILTIDKDSSNRLSKNNLLAADVAFEFSQPDSAFQNINQCFDAGIPVVCGTTGWDEKLPEIQQRCFSEAKALFFAPNFSIGMNIFMKINEALAEMMEVAEDYNLSINEVHHTQKLDAPSGTAIKLAQDILELNQKYKTWTKKASDKNDEFPITSERKGNVTGIHTVKYDSPLDFIEITHHLKDRRSLAEGAVLAAEFIIGKQGFFNMDSLFA
ncbi:MAG: 4-hydroxy-tetrahydrodipicolinate reductase [Bacteroidota bacterium]|nr:4-hydroxy-tetrahydrodipicolinate reductase [Bacteroidota bacterium]